MLDSCWKNHTVGLRDRSIFATLHYGCLRAQSARYLELSHLQIRKIPDQGSSECWALILVLNQGKTNQVNRKEEASMIRCADANTCAIGALAFWLFWRFVIKNEAFPSLDNNDWYTKKVYPPSLSRVRSILQSLNFYQIF